MNNNKGLTLIELILTVTIMLIITIIAVPTSIQFIKRSKTQQYSTLESQILSAASKYYIKHKDTKCIELNNLVNDIDEKYLDGSNIIDPRDNSILTDKVKVTINGKTIKYELVNNCN